MRAFTLDEAWQLALQDADMSARKTYRFRQFFIKVDRIKRRRGWIPWWESRSVDSPKRVGAR